MKRSTKLTKSERDEIFILKERGYGVRAIGRALGRSPNTISYELAENSTNCVYDPKKAHQQALADRKYRKLNWMKIEESHGLKAYVIAGLEKHWNPDEISGRMRQERQKFYVSKTAIYEWLRSARGQSYCPLLYSKRYRKKKRKPKTERELIPHRVGLEKRPLGATHRTRYGHWEADAVVSRRGGSGSLSVAQERKSKIIAVKKCATMRPTEHALAQKKLQETYLVNSETFDNGIENQYHEKLGVPTFFCDPYSSWQKGGVENANKMIRRYFPKGTDFFLVSQTEVDRAVSLINNKPRKILGYRSAVEVATASGVVLQQSTAVS